MDQGRIHDIDAVPPWVADVFDTPEGHILPSADGPSGHSYRLPPGDFLPELGPDRNDGVLTVDDGSHTVRVCVHSDVKVTSRYLVVALLDLGSPR